MAISSSNYIDTNSVISSDVVGSRDWSGLVFTSQAVKSGASGTKVTDYSANKVVSVTMSEIASMFDSTTEVYKIASGYFGYVGGNHTPTVLNLYKIESDDTVSKAYAKAIALYQNFGAFTVSSDVGASASALSGLATANKSSKYQMIICTKKSANDITAIATALKTIANLHVFVCASDTVDGGVTTTYTKEVWAPLAWYASVDYDKANASATIDYKQFGVNYAIDSNSDKSTYDGYNFNYVGLVNGNGGEFSFYQTGKNTNGEDMGVARDRMWIESEIVAGWFNLTMNSQKIPANVYGASMVRAMINDVVTRAITAGVILIDKPLTSTQKLLITQYCEDDAAVDDVETYGYHIETKIVYSDSTYKCQYVLAYAKGDHISKVVGTNVLG